MEANELTPSQYEEIRGGLIRQAIDAGKPDPTDYEVAKVVAEISLKAGYEQGKSEDAVIEYRDFHYEDGRLAGIKEVVEELRKYERYYESSTHVSLHLTPEELIAFKKSKGIE